MVERKYVSWGFFLLYPLLQVDARTTREPSEEEQKKWRALHEEALEAVKALRVNFARVPFGATRAG